MRKNSVKGNKITIHDDIAIIHIFSKKYGRIVVAIDTEDIDKVNANLNFSL